MSYVTHFKMFFDEVKFQFYSHYVRSRLLTSFLTLTHSSEILTTGDKMKPLASVKSGFLWV